MNCHFCQRECETEGNVAKFIAHTCDNHAHQVTYLIGNIPDTIYYGKLCAWVFPVSYKEKKYVVEAYVYENHREFVIGSSDGESNILRFNYIPDNITPDNIDNKIATLIIFS